MKLVVNRIEHELPDDLADPAMPLLWALRDLLNLTGTKYGCGIGACGACTVRLDGQAARACQVTLAQAQKARQIQTIEGLGTAQTPHPLQRAWLDHQVPQCGYCQSGLLMAAAALLGQYARPSDAQIETQISHLCRCGSLVRVRQAIRSAAQQLPASGPPEDSVMPAEVAARLPDQAPALLKGSDGDDTARRRALARARAAKARAMRQHRHQGDGR